MEDLWKREGDEIEAHYVEILTGDEIESAEDYIEQFVFHESQKCDLQSTYLRMEGNDSYRTKDWTEAMNYYNESLSYAEIGSENEALAYSNRSACFFKMKMYEKVLVDIELALTSNIPDRLNAKMLKRKQDAIDLLKDFKPPAQSDLKLDFKPHEKYPCLSNVLDLRFNQKLGRHMIATEDIPVGKIIVREKEYTGFSATVTPKCNTCFQECVNFIACPQCANTLFCNKDCMIRNKVHKWLCSVRFNAIPWGVEYELRMVLSALDMFKTVDNLMQFVEDVLQEDPGSMPPSQDDISNYHFFFKLNKCSTELAQKRFAVNCLIYAILMNLPNVADMFDNEKKERFLMHLIVHHCMLFLNNGFAGGEETGHSLYKNLAMFNHSCNPNLNNLSLEGRVSACFTIRPVQKGDQLCVNYLEREIHLKSERQTMLQKNWGFVCKCDLCESGKYADEIWLNANIRLHAENLEGSTNYIEFMEKMEAFLMKYGHLEFSDVIRTVATKYGQMAVVKLCGL